MASFDVIGTGIRPAASYPFTISSYPRRLSADSLQAPLTAYGSMALLGRQAGTWCNSAIQLKYNSKWGDE